MAEQNPESTKTHYDSKSKQLICCGDWDLPHIRDLKALLEKIAWPQSGDVTFDGSQVKKMDSAGAWLINMWRDQLERRKLTVHIENFPHEQQELISLVEKRIKTETKIPTITPLPWVAKIGQMTVQQYHELCEYLAFIGEISLEFLRILHKPQHWRFNAIAAVVFRTGYQALFIIAILSLMIGIVITYQMGLQLKNYGANIYIVDLLGLSVLREFGPLITAIMVAGRTGSAFTAQLGIMKINQEIDALDTIGVTSTELLLLPRIIGLVISLPLLIMWADIFGVLGGMIMSNNMLSITWYDFLHRFSNVIPLRALLIGLGKAPVFALIIASIGCFQGMQVKENADSVGLNTTRSVVMAIFFIIVADAVFSVIFSKLKL